MGDTTLGVRVRELRLGRGLSLDRLAASSGVSRSMISEIERGGRVPTVLVLDKVATSLGTSIARLVRDPSPDEPVVLRRAEQDEVVDPSGWRRRIVSPVLPGVEFELVRTTLGPRVEAGTFPPHAAGSREYVAVERGTLALFLDGRSVRLDAGDSVSYPGDCRHRFVNPRRAACVYYLATDIATGHVPDADLP